MALLIFFKFLCTLNLFSICVYLCMSVVNMYMYTNSYKIFFFYFIKSWMNGGFSAFAKPVIMIQSSTLEHFCTFLVFCIISG